MSQGRRIATLGREYQDLPTRRLDDARPVGHRKNTRRWCLGRKGREHELSGWRPIRFTWLKRPEPYGAIRVCLNCGKHVEHHSFGFNYAWTRFFENHNDPAGYAHKLAAQCDEILKEKPCRSE